MYIYGRVGGPRREKVKIGMYSHVKASDRKNHEIRGPLSLECRIQNAACNTKYSFLLFNSFLYKPHAPSISTKILIKTIRLKKRFHVV